MVGTQDVENATHDGHVSVVRLAIRHLEAGPLTPRLRCAPRTTTVRRVQKKLSGQRTPLFEPGCCAVFLRRKELQAFRKQAQSFVLAEHRGLVRQGAHELKFKIRRWLQRGSCLDEGIRPWNDVGPLQQSSGRHAPLRNAPVRQNRCPSRRWCSRAAIRNHGFRIPPALRSLPYGPGGRIPARARGLPR